MQARTLHVEALYALTAGFIAERTSQEWVDTLAGLDIPCGAINRLDDLFEDPHLRATGFFSEAGTGAMRLAGQGVRFDGRPCPAAAPPQLGQHTRELLREAGFPQDAIDALIASGVARAHP